MNFEFQLINYFVNFINTGLITEYLKKNNN